MTKRRKTAVFTLALLWVILQVILFSSSPLADTANLALGKPITASSYTQTYVATNANDGNVYTYWEGAPNSYPNLLTVDLGSAQTVYKVVIKLNPDPIWATRVQTFSILTSTDGSTYTTTVASNTYTFDPATGNTVTVAFSEVSARYVRLSFTANSGATGGQAAEFEVYGPGSSGQPDLVVTDISWSPVSPVAGNEVTFGATIKNQGTAATPAGVIHGVSFWVDGVQVSWSDTYTSSIPAGGTVTVTANWGPNNKATWTATSGTHTVMAWVDDVNRITNEANENNNTYSETMTVGSSGGQQPYGGTPATIADGAKIEAERYDTGGEGVAYHDTTTGNTGGAFRSDDVDIEACGEGGYNVGWIVNGEWLEYTVNVTPGTYNIIARVASAGSGTIGDLRILLDGVELGVFPVGSTGGWQTYTNVTLNNVTLAGGNNKILRLEAVNGGDFNINYIQFVSAGSTPPPQGRYEAENASLFGGAKVNTDHTGYSGTGFVDGYWNLGATTTFTVSVPSAGYYDVTLRYGNAMGSAMTVSIYVNGTKIRQTSLPNLANWDTWANKVEPLYLNSGSNTIAYKYDSGDTGNINIDYIEVAATTVQKPDLIVTDVTPTGAIEGDAVAFQAVIKNIGTQATASGTTHYVDFYVDGTKVASGSTSSSIAVGASVTITASTNWTAAGVGTHTVRATADATGTIAEIDENNNSKEITFIVNQKPGIDLIVTDITWSPSNPSAGNAVTFSAIVKNQGTIATPSGTAVTVRIVIDGNTTLTSTNYTSSIPAGGSATITPSGTWTATNGNHSVTATVDYNNIITETNENNNSYTKTMYIGRGAQVPWITYEAENGTTNATVVGPNRLVGDLAGEASGRMAVRLTSTGHYVEWTTTAPANAIVIRHCIPDAPSGGGITAAISLYVDGVHRQDITLTSKHAWLYGDEANPVNDPNAGNPRRIYDEAHALVGDIPAGAKVRLQKDAGDTAAYYGIDFIELEQVAPPKTKPDNYLSITDFGAVPNDTVDDSQAIQQCIITASQQGKGVWIPEGVFYQTQKLMAYSNVTVQGAGMWYSMLYDPTGSYGDWGNIGFNLAGADNFKVYDLALFAEGTIRDTGGKAFCYSPGSGFEVGNVWIEHTNCGFWLGASIPTVGAHIYNVRIRNTFADGLNLCNSSKNCIVEHCTARNTGDDSFAIWSATDLSSAPCEGNLIKNCTAQLPWRANAFAIYGGKDNTIEDCVAMDTLTYGGVNISSCFNPVPFSGTTTVQRVSLIRCGGAFWGGLQFGALWLNCDDSDMSGIVCKDIEIVDSTFSGLHIQSETYGHNPPHVISGTSFENITITGSGTDGIYIRAGSSGSATFSYVSVSGSANSPLRNDAPTTFTIVRGAGNTGW
ncbi:MAG: carbohydrate-binding protein [Firmicutes bacterium]|nr:carbohydrate-binding protein [Bacillota bacterium]